MRSMWSDLLHGPSEFIAPAIGVVTTHTIPRRPPKPITPAKVLAPPPPARVRAAPPGPAPRKTPRPSSPVNIWGLSIMQERVMSARTTVGATTEEVTQALKITEQTMRTHLSRARKRMGVQTVPQALDKWLRRTMACALASALESQRAQAEEHLIRKLAQR